LEQRLAFQLIFSVTVVAAALVVTWLLLGDSSPLHAYFIWHVSLPNAWAMTTALPYVAGAVLSGNPHSPSMAIVLVALIVQWFVIGFVLSIPFSRYWQKRRRQT